MLEEIVKVKRAEVERYKARMSPDRIRGEALATIPARDFKAALLSRECAVIAEIKRRSPSRGWLREGVHPVDMADIYGKNSAAAISVLTDQTFFGGHVRDLAAVSRAVSVPVLRKDFIIDPCQIYEARAAGADAVLLIVGILEDQTLAEYIALAQSLDMSSLVEVHSHRELDRALGAGAGIIGINNRDLQTFKTDLNVSLEMASRIPEGCLAVSESGIHNRGDIERLMRAGIHAFLIGEALMAAPDAGMKLKELMGL